MNYLDVYNLLKTGGGAGSGRIYGGGGGGYATWYHDGPMEESVNNMVRSIWYSDGTNEIEVKEEKKNVKTESQHPDDGCIYW